MNQGKYLLGLTFLAFFGACTQGAGDVLDAVQGKNTSSSDGSGGSGSGSGGGPVCGNFICEAGEVAAICPADCTFTNNGNGTIIDNTSGLTWLKCSVGQNLTSSTCSGTAGTYQFCTAADNSCNGGSNTGTLTSGPAFSACAALNGTTFGGKTGWHVPTTTEWESLNWYGIGSAAVSHYFPSASSLGNWLWSSNSSSSTVGCRKPNAASSGNSGNWGLGCDYTWGKTTVFPILCVTSQ